MAEVATRARALLKEASVPSLAQIEGTLRDLGLTGYASQVFCAALGSPQTTAGELVVKTGIPDSKIYYALNELVERGLLEVQGGKPKTYRVGQAREVEGRLQRLIEGKHERERAAVTRVVSLLEPLQAGAQAPSTDLAFVVKGQANVFARANAMILSARKEVVVLTSEEPVLRAVEAALDRASKRRVRVKLAGPLIPLLPGIGRAAETRQIVCTCVLTLVVDGEQILTGNRGGDGSMYGITSTDATLVRFGLEYWESPRCCAAG